LVVVQGREDEGPEAMVVPVQVESSQQLLGELLDEMAIDGE
jgi:hypothetical protein